MSDRHNDQPSHSVNTKLSVFWSPSLLSNQQLQAVLVVGLLWRAGGQKGCGHGGPCCCGNTEEGVSVDAGGCRVAECRGCCDAGEVDAECESSLLQGFLRHCEGLKLLFTVGHIGVLATSTDTIQACLKKMTENIQGMLL